MNDIVLQDLDSGLLTITMNRPDRRNALNPDMTLGLVEAARRAAEDHEVRAVLLKGAGGTFCVGGDVKSMAEGRAPLPFEAKMTNLRRAMEVSRILHEMSKPVVAQLDGAAAGAGLSIALACDLRVASDAATFAFPEIDGAWMPSHGGTARLPRMVGRAKALELLLTGAEVRGRPACDLGFVDHVTARGKTLGKALDLARTFAAKPRTAVHAIKRALTEGEEKPYRNRFLLEAQHSVQLLWTDAYREAQERARRKGSA